MEVVVSLRLSPSEDAIVRELKRQYADTLQGLRLGGHNANYTDAGRRCLWDMRNALAGSGAGDRAHARLGVQGLPTNRGSSLAEVMAAFVGAAASRLQAACADALAAAAKGVAATAGLVLLLDAATKQAAAADADEPNKGVVSVGGADYDAADLAAVAQANTHGIDRRAVVAAAIF